MLSADFTINRKNNKIDLLRFGRNTRKSRKSAITFEINYNLVDKLFFDLFSGYIMNKQFEIAI